MSRADILNLTPRPADEPRDSQAWRATLAAAQRVMGYYATKAERGAMPVGAAGAASSSRNDPAPTSRLAA